jgi:hypothetical protein
MIDIGDTFMLERADLLTLVSQPFFEQNGIGEAYDGQGSTCGKGFGGPREHVQIIYEGGE